MTDEQQHGVVVSAIDAGRQVLGTLPGQFLALLLINACFVLGLLWFLHAQGAARERVINTIVSSCLERK